MAQVGLPRLGDGLLVVDLQTDLIGLDASRIVTPLRAEGAHVAFPGLTPVVEAEGRRWLVRVPELAAVPAVELGAPVGSLAAHRDALKRALGILIVSLPEFARLWVICFQGLSDSSL